MKKNLSLKLRYENAVESVHCADALYSICEISVADTEAFLLFNINYQAIHRSKMLYLF